MAPVFKYVHLQMSKVSLLYSTAPRLAVNLAMRNSALATEFALDASGCTVWRNVFAVFLVVLLITGSVFLAVLVIFSVLLVDLFLIAMVPLWDLTFNNITVVHLIASLGLSVLYSVHIALSFYLVDAPNMPKPK